MSSAFSTMTDCEFGEANEQLVSLLYVSRITITANERESEINRIVSLARERNSLRRLTGALLSTHTHFAQILEGEAEAVNLLIGALRSDPRHDQLQIVDWESIAARRFTGWSMAYSGHSQFVSSHVTRLLDDASPIGRDRAAEWLVELMHEFVTQNSTAQP